MSDEQAMETLSAVKAEHGRRYKAVIREAWETGAYRYGAMRKYAGELQTLRNSRGPSWLCRVTVKASN